jgi:hypothetical protein
MDTSEMVDLAFRLAVLGLWIVGAIVAAFWPA